jgi:REP element-mobilizing transposase RayT
MINGPRRGQTKNLTMANTYSQLFFHTVFAVRNRESLINGTVKSHLYPYIVGIIAHQGQKLFIVNGMPDHVHLLLNCKPDFNLSSLIREVKEHSTKYINQQGLTRGKFCWQAGFGAFSVSKREVGKVLNYIKTQEEHHQTKTFRKEYVELLKENEIDFKERYIFDLVLPT